MEKGYLLRLKCSAMSQLTKYIPALKPEWATIIAAIIAFVGGCIVTYFAYIVRNRRERSKDLANYLDSIASCLSSMCDSFERGEIPTQSGHVLEALIKYGDQELQNATGKEFQSFKVILKKILADAVDADWDMRNAVELYYPGGVTKWIHKSKQVIGLLQGRAATLKAKK